MLTLLFKIMISLVAVIIIGFCALGVFMMFYTIYEIISGVIVDWKERKRLHL